MSKALTDNLWLAVGFASLNALMLAGMSLFAKLLATYFGPLEVTFFRNGFSLIALLAWLFFARKLYLLKTDRPWAHLFRSSIGTAGVILGMWALSILSLSETTILLFTSPLFTTLLSVVFLKERVGLLRILAVICGFTGVIVMAEPWNGFSLPILGLVVGLGWGFFSGSVDTCLRWIGKTENSSATVFYFMLLGVLVTSLHLPFAEFTDQSFSMPALLIIAGLGITGLISLMAKTQSFRLGKASVIAPVMYTMLIWTAAFDYFVWGNVPGKNVLLGGAIIIGSNLFILYRQTRLEKAE